MPPSEPHFAERGTTRDVEQARTFQPKFNAEGLIPAIVSEATTGAILMFAWMNAEALALTIASRVAHFHSRSRGRLWKKGEDSGNLLSVVEMTTDCDQDVIAIKVVIAGAGVACHTGAHTCFYRTVDLGEPGAAGYTLSYPLAK